MGVDLAAWVALALGAAIAGFSKTAIAGANTIAVALFAMMLPAKESTGVLLVLLICGDLIAISTYRRDARWDIIVKLIGPVIVGIGLGTVFLTRVDGIVMRRTIGWILLVLTAFQIGLMVRAARAERHTDHDGAQAVPSHGGGAGRLWGSMAGFTTMVANAGGPPMSLYLLRARLSVIDFVGTMAWFFFVVNLTKLPVSIGLGLVRPQRIGLVLSLIPALLIGAAIGRAVIRRIDRDLFERLVIGFVIVSAAYLALR